MSAPDTAPAMRYIIARRLRDRLTGEDPATLARACTCGIGHLAEPLTWLASRALITYNHGRVIGTRKLMSVDLVDIIRGTVE